MPPLEGVNPNDFEADDSNIERDGRVALHHRLELQGPSHLAPIPLWPRALLRANPRAGFLSMTWGRECGGSLHAWVRGAVCLPSHIMA